MKKSAILLLVVSLVFTASCGKEAETVSEPVASVSASVSEESQTSASEESQVSVSEEVQEEPDYTEAYKKILDETFDLIVSGGLVGTLEEDYNSMGVWEHILYTRTEDALGEIGYGFKDLSGDGIAELIIGLVDSANIMEIFTLDGDKPQFVVGGWDRSSLQLLSDGSFYSFVSGGAAYSGIANFTLTSDGKTLVYKDFYFTDEKEVDGELVEAFYHNTTGEWEAGYSDAVDMTYDGFWAMEQDMGDRVVKNALTPFESYKTIVPEGAANANISVAWADETTGTDYWYFYDSYDEDVAEIVVSTDVNVRNVTFKRLSLTGVDENGKAIYDKEEMFTTTLFANKPLVVAVKFLGDTPNIGFSYTDSDGTEKECVISVSGMDGSPVLTDN